MVAIESEAKTLSELKVEEMEARTFIYRLIPEIINDIVEREVEREVEKEKTNIASPEMEDFSSSTSTFSDGSDVTYISAEKVTTGTQTETGPMYVIRNQIDDVLRRFTCFWNFPRYIF